MKRERSSEPERRSPIRREPGGKLPHTGSESGAPFTSSKPEPPFAKVFSLLFGAFLGLALLKFGNAVIMERFIERPTNGWEWFLNPWPFGIAYAGLTTLGLLGLFAAKWQKPRPAWLVVLPLAWLVWQFVAATHAVEATLTSMTLKHFATCAGCFYLGYFALSVARKPWFLFGLIAGFGVVLAAGIQQHFGGLEESRRYFFTYLYPQMTDVPPEYLKKIRSDRIWATLFYPNALAGVLLLLLPVTLVFVMKYMTRLTVGARRFVAAVFGVGALGCLFWSGSKGGWLLMLVLVLVALLHLDFPMRWKILVICAVAVGGLAGFGLKYAGFFRKGATSVGARFDYWEAAFATTRANPVFGTGPGTFAIPYQRIKRPESEMSRLVHNDYLQQASDSGVIGFAAYLALILGWLGWTKGQLRRSPDPLRFAVWLGLLVWLLQGLMEFGLYIPALAWTAFALMGWLLGSGNRFDNPAASR
jgi:O-antigen ligase